MRSPLFLVLFIPLIIAVEQKVPQAHECHSERHEDTKTSAVPANSEFALKLYRHVASKSPPARNIVFSPLSISAAFSMLALGAGSTTHQEIWATLGFNQLGCKESTIHRSFSHLLQELNKAQGELQLQIGNAVFVDNSLKLEESFEDQTQSYYQAEVSRTDYKRPKEAEKWINDFVKNKTQGRIKDAIKDIDPGTQLVLINYVFFTGLWERSFSPDLTRIQRFSVDNVTEVDVPTMHRIGRYPTLFDTHLPCTVVEIAYKNNASMIIAVAEPGQIHAVEQALSIHTVRRWRKAMTIRFINLQLPKFSIQSTLKVEDHLSDLGINSAFRDSADFSRISRQTLLKVSKVVHKAVMDVDEKGTVAAATTKLELTPLASFPVVNINRPFVSLICDGGTGSILFVATVLNPLEK